MFSIIIPTFNNFDYLKICLGSIQKNSEYSHEIVLHINDGSDGTYQYADSKKIIFTHTTKNVGVCTAVNLAACKATKKYLLYTHDDMYFCPGWDSCLVNEINNLRTIYFYLSGKRIQIEQGDIDLNCGNSFQNFDEAKLLKNYNLNQLFDSQGSHWAPHLIHADIWKKIRGFSEEFNPGVGSDPDLNMKLWKNDVRIFKALSNFRVYHFGSTVLRKKINIKRNKGSKTFLLKWGITIDFFKKFYLKTGQKYKGPLNDPKKDLNYYKSFFLCKIKFYLIYFSQYFFSRKNRI